MMPFQKVNNYQFIQWKKQFSFLKLIFCSYYSYIGGMIVIYNLEDFPQREIPLLKWTFLWQEKSWFNLLDPSPNGENIKFELS